MPSSLSTVPSLFLLKEVWREVSRHLEIHDFARSLLPLLQGETRVQWLSVLRWGGERRELERVGEAGALPENSTHRLSLTDSQARTFSEWGDSASPLLLSGPSREPWVRAVIPPSWTGFSGVGAITDDASLKGLLVLGSDAPLARGVVQEILEPCSVALGNEARLLELARLKEAAEADRRALLQRLDRQDIVGSVVGAAHGLREVMDQVSQVAPTDAPVLILGETGSGKEVIAREVHSRSPRGKGPFLRVNCGAIPHELVDSELFGHERGAFTGAVATRKGWFERADGGTLFLDEIGELPPAAQVRLLRVLQDGTLQRVGGQSQLGVDVRIVAATHRDMVDLVRSGRFRQDLWYRISVFPLSLPPLRERIGDIPALALHFAERAGLRLHGAPLRPSEEDMELLRAYSWPGNVRELAAVIERAAILGDGSHLRVQAALGVFPTVRESPLPSLSPSPFQRSAGTGSPSAPAFPSATETPTLLEVLARCRGRIEGPFGAAAALGIHPATLRSRLRREGIDWTAWRNRS